MLTLCDQLRDQTAKLSVVDLEAPSLPINNQLEATMRRIAITLSGLVGMAAAFTGPAAAYETDPLTGQPIQYYYGQPYYYGQQPFYGQTYRPQASGIGRQVVPFSGRYGAGTIVISTAERRLYYTLGNGQAIQYAVGVGRPGFEWGGVKTITTKREWPDWRPPAQMLRRRPDLPRYMSGGINNPLGARAMYLGGSLYRIHGSNEPETIGQAVSSGCIRMTNEDVIDLYNRARVGTKVVVMR
jgi:lipoprotein-anchoring transpeptidase ErfK/SrfK